MPWNFTLIFFLSFRFFKAKVNTDGWGEFQIWFDVESSKHFGRANPYQEEDWQSWKNEKKFEDSRSFKILFFLFSMFSVWTWENYLIFSYLSISACEIEIICSSSSCGYSQLAFTVLFQDSQLEIEFFFSIYFIHIFFLYCTVIKTSKLHYHIWRLLLKGIREA